MKTIFFTGLAGGAGKTTLAINFARYLHYYEKRRVLLLSCDLPSILPLLQEQHPFPFAARDIAPTSLAAYLNALKANPDAPEFVLVDIPINLKAWGILLLAQYLIIPFEYSLVHYGKLSAFLSLAHRMELSNALLLLPNKVTRPNTNLKQQFDTQVLAGKDHLLPFIPTSAQLAVTSSKPFTPSEFQLVRPCFSHILNKV